MLADLIARLEALDKAAGAPQYRGKWEADGEADSWTEEGYAQQWVVLGDREWKMYIPTEDTGSGMCEARDVAEGIATLRNELPRLLRLLRAGEKAQAILRASLDSPCFDCERAYVDAKSSEAALREWDEAARG